MPVKVDIRRAQARYVLALMAICEEHAAFEQLPHDPAGGEDRLCQAMAGRSPRLYAWLAWIEDQLAGYASATVDFSTLDRAQYLHMDCLYVREGWRGQSIGMRLWEHVRDHALALECVSMQWQTPSWNEGAARFYRRLGAKESVKLRYGLTIRC